MTAGPTSRLTSQEKESLFWMVVVIGAVGTVAIIGLRIAFGILA